MLDGWWLYYHSKVQKHKTDTVWEERREGWAIRDTVRWHLMVSSRHLLMVSSRQQAANSCQRAPESVPGSNLQLRPIQVCRSEKAPTVSPKAVSPEVSSIKGFSVAAKGRHNMLWWIINSASELIVRLKSKTWLSDYAKILVLVSMTYSHKIIVNLVVAVSKLTWIS